MKKTILLLGCSLATLGAYADGNFSASNIIGGVTHTIFLADGVTKVPKLNGKFDVSVTGSASPFFSGSFKLAGVFSAGAVEVPGAAPGSSVNLTFRFWDAATGATYADATQGFTTSFDQVLGNVPGVPAPSLPTELLNFPATVKFGTINGTPVVPEPTTLALAALGLGGLFFVSRRK